MAIDGLFLHYFICQRVSKNSFFAIFHDFLKNWGEIFFEERHPEIDEGHQFYTIKLYILFLPTIVDFSKALEKCHFSSKLHF